jgi:dsDNA-specific endonuclease/ATPase MutS2
MAEPVSVISVVAAAVSAIASAFAAVAAFRSAASARTARDAADKAEKRAALRQLALAANEVLVEARRAESRAAELKLAYRTLFTFGGSSGGSREVLYLAEVDKRLAEIAKLSEAAKPFTSGQEGLINGPLEEIGGRETKVTQTLTQVRAIREDLEREHASVEGQCATYRELALRGPTR